MFALLYDQRSQINSLKSKEISHDCKRSIEIAIDVDHAVLDRVF